MLAFATTRDETLRLPVWLDHHRRLGVDHFLVVDNASTDGSAAMLADQPDVSLWSTAASYKAARFGMDWLGALMVRHGHGHWCLTLDADELLIYAHHDTRPLGALTDWLDDHGVEAMGALMLDLYPRGPLSTALAAPGDDPATAIPWFDAGNYLPFRQPRHGELRIQGGPRARVFFAEAPRRAPTLSKLPLVRWNRRHVYIASTHAALPRRLNAAFAALPGPWPSGVLLHTKFLADVTRRSAEELDRRQMRTGPDGYDDYYHALIDDPTLWTPHSTRLEDWRQLERLGLLSRGGWE